MSARQEQTIGQVIEGALGGVIGVVSFIWKPDLNSPPPNGPTPQFSSWGAADAWRTAQAERNLAKPVDNKV